MVVSEWGVACQGDFEPIVGQESFRAVQAILSGRRPTVTPHIRNHPDFPLHRFVRCSKCERPLTGSWSKGRQRHYPYYRCSNSRCKGVNIKKAKLEGRFVTLLEHMQPRPECIRLFREIVLDVWNQQSKDAAEATPQSGSNWQRFGTPNLLSFAPSGLSS